MIFYFSFLISLNIKQQQIWFENEIFLWETAFDSMQKSDENVSILSEKMNIYELNVCAESGRRIRGIVYFLQRLLICLIIWEFKLEGERVRLACGVVSFSSITNANSMNLFRLFQEWIGIVISSNSNNINSNSRSNLENHSKGKQPILIADHAW